MGKESGRPMLRSAIMKLFEVRYEWLLNNMCGYTTCIVRAHSAKEAERQVKEYDQGFLRIVYIREIVENIYII